MSQHCLGRVVAHFPLPVQIELQNGRQASLIVRKIRLEAGLSQEQLAHMAGISTRTLQQIKRGTNASPESSKCIASVLETDFGYLREEQKMPIETQPPMHRLSTEERGATEYVRDIRAFYMQLMA